MKQIVVFVLSIFLVVVAYFVMVRGGVLPPSQETVTPSKNQAYYFDPETGMSFTFGANSNEFTAVSVSLDDQKNEKPFFTLYEKNAYDSFRQSSAPREYPPSVQLWKFPYNGESLLDWAQKHRVISNFDDAILRSPPRYANIADTQGLFYLSDGLYVTRYAVFAHDDTLYLIAGNDENQSASSARITEAFDRIVGTIHFEK